MPDWIQICTAARTSESSLNKLDAGEREAILIAEELQADQLLMDDRRGRKEARRRGIETVGTLSLLQTAGKFGLLDLPAAMERLQKTNFFMTPKLLADVLKNEP
jgi:predicted nucleic acid-binding protein